MIKASIVVTGFGINQQGGAYVHGKALTKPSCIGSSPSIMVENVLKELSILK
jgi:hypothetical protein